MVRGITSGQKGSFQPGSSGIRILLVSNAFNTMTQKIFLECQSARHKVDFHEYVTPEEMIATVRKLSPQMIVCPFLTKRVPAEIYRDKTVPCLIVHPGIEGDRGASSIDWALQAGSPEWGVTILQAEEEMDAGEIWSSHNFSTKRPLGGPPSKSSLYRFECIDAAVKGVKRAIEMYVDGTKPHPLDYYNTSVKGQLRPSMKQADRAVDWTWPAEKVCRFLRASDSQPGTLEVLNGLKYFLYNAIEESDSSHFKRAPAKTLLGKRDGAVLVKCGTGAVWVTHLKQSQGIKLAATSILPKDLVDRLPELPQPPLNVEIMKTPKTFQVRKFHLLLLI